MRDEIKALLLGPLLAVDIRQVVVDSMNAHDADMVELNQTQLAKGQRADENTIKPYYKPRTVKARKKKGKQTTVVDLDDKHKFYDGMYAKPDAKGNTDIGSSDPKTVFLVARYGEVIFGLSEPSLEQLGDRMKPTIQNNFKKAVG